LSIDHHSTIVLTIASGKIDFIGNYNKVVGGKHHENFTPVTDDMSINPYWFHEHFDGAAKEFLTKAIKELKGEGWFDNSDIMTDYFHVKHYVNVKVGKWNRPYVLTNN